MALAQRERRCNEFVIVIVSVTEAVSKGYDDRNLLYDGDDDIASIVVAFNERDDADGNNCEY